MSTSDTATDAGTWVGRTVPRKEDQRLLRGFGTYIDDVPEPRGTLHLAMLRSPYAHARILSIDTSEAEALDGVVAVVTGADIAELIPPFAADYEKPGFKVSHRSALAPDTVRFVGDGVALVLAENAYIAEDALGLIFADYEPLPSVADVEDALKPDAPRIHADLDDNILIEGGNKTDGFDEVFEAADNILRERFRVNRVAGTAMEPRGCLAVYEKADDSVTLWTGTQVPHLLRVGIARYLGWSESQLRVVAPDVGGGFGPKMYLYPEELLTVAMARQYRSPVKWIEDRLEDFLTTFHARDHVYDVAVAYNNDGTVQAVEVDVLVNSGAYSNYPMGVNLEPFQGPLNMPGPYRFRQFAYTTKGVATNTCSTGAFRGVSAPCVTFAMEGMMDRIARHLGIDRVDVRRRNIVRPDEFPYVNVVNQLYVSGSYVECMDRALEIVDYENYLANQPPERLVDGKYRGIGIAVVTELGGQGAARYKARSLPDLPGFDTAHVELEPNGRILATTSFASQGQGHETTFAQIIADELGVSIGDITIRGGDTENSPFGTGTFASRGAVVAGGAVMRASGDLRQKVKKFAAHLLEASADDIVLEDGHAHVQGVREMRVSLYEVARAAYGLTDSMQLPEGEEFGLEAIATYDPPASSISNACHVACVAVDAATGLVEVERYIVVHDCGRVVNPLLVKGQVQGGVAQGLGQALFEEVLYDSDGQLLSATLMDYLVPTALDVPTLEMEHIESPATDNIGGFKGAGEGGVIGALPAIACAVGDALVAFGGNVNRLPLRPDAVLELIEGGNGA